MRKERLVQVWSRAAWTVAAVVALIAPISEVRAQQGVVAAVTAGGTYYCIVTRCNTGQALGLAAGAELTAGLSIEASARRHFCFDCDRFVIADAGASWTVPARGRVRPFLSGGIGFTSDPEFFGHSWSPYLSVGAWYWPTEKWGGQLALRGRRVAGDLGLAEATVSLARRWGGR
jgi:hypothetical protein